MDSNTKKELRQWRRQINLHIKALDNDDKNFDSADRDYHFGAIAYCMRRLAKLRVVDPGRKVSAINSKGK